MSDRSIYVIINVQPGSSPELIDAVERLITLAREDASAGLQAERRFVAKGDVYSDFERLFADEIGGRLAAQFAGRTWTFLADDSSHYGLPYLVVCNRCSKLRGDCRCSGYDLAEISKRGEEGWTYLRGAGSWKLGVESIIRTHPEVIAGDFRSFGPRNKHFMTRWVDQL